MQNKIVVNNLTMRFKATEALKNISVTFEGGKIYGLLGRNGAGKTTLLNVINNRLIPTEGNATIDGMSVYENDRALAKVYYVGEKQLMPEDMRVKSYFGATARFFGFNEEYANRLAKSFGLDTSKKLKNLSTGYGTIAKLITALASDAEYLLLDEPVLGLDANHRDMFYRELLENYAANPRTIILSTHLIEEISGLVEQVVVIKEGEILLATSAEEMLAMGYCVSGKAEDVEAYCADKQVLSMDALGALRSACILGKPEAIPDTLQHTALDMQKLFVHLTNS
jgi:ABC-2 type transport system ATP-binding protein